MSTTLLVDGHVHYHSCFGVDRFLRNALCNFRVARGELGQSDAVGCLMFSESSWCHFFRSFAGGLIEQEAPEWTVESTDEDFALFVRTPQRDTLLLIAGRQVVTAERLEVLALATAQEFEDGLPLRDAVAAVTASGAIPVVPWGFGKWTGRRGRAVRALLASRAADQLYLGDNGGRPGLTPDPPLFRFAAERGVPILPGSDPLPIAAEVRKPGRYGFVLQGALDLRTPAASVKQTIATRSPPPRFGRLEALPTFLLRQTQLRLARRGPAKKPAAVPSETKP